MANTRPDDAWEKFGRMCPYFGVITDPRFKGKALDPAARSEFFASGEAHVRDVLATIASHLDPDFLPLRALDFGCGVGRITLPLAHRAREVVGMDISPSMLEEALKNTRDAGLTNVLLVRSDDELSGATGTFNFIHSYIVFQHIEPQRGEVLFRKLIRRLGESGVGVAHFTFEKRLPLPKRVWQSAARTIPLLHNIMNLIRGRSFSYPLMQMNSYNLNRLHSILMEEGCHQVFSRFSDHGGHLGVVLYFLKRRLP